MWEIYLLYGFLLFSEGFINFFFQGAWKITNMIYMSDLDRFLTRPISVGLQLLTAKIDFDGLNKMVIAAALLGIGISKCEIHWTVFKGIFFLAFLAEACVIRLCMIWIASCMSFWMKSKSNSLNYFVISLGRNGKISSCYLSADFSGDFRIFDTLCICQLLSGRLYSGKGGDDSRGSLYTLGLSLYGGCSLSDF